MARCTVLRLMRSLGIEGVVRGKKLRTTFADPAAPFLGDKVCRQFDAERPNLLLVSDSGDPGMGRVER